MVWLRAWFGWKPGSGRTIRLLPTVEDVPGEGWRHVDQRTFRTGVMTPDNPRSRRAREAGKISAIRSFQQAATARFMWAQVSPMANEVDAREVVTEGPTLLANPSPKTTITGERTLEGFIIPGCDASWAHEMELTVQEDGEEERRVANQMIGGAVGSFVLVVFGKCADGESTWNDLVAMAQVMVGRIRESAL